MVYVGVVLNWSIGSQQSGVTMGDLDRGTDGNHQMVPRELLSGDGIHVIVNVKKDLTFTPQYYCLKQLMENMYQFRVAFTRV